MQDLSTSPTLGELRPALEWLQALTLELLNHGYGEFRVTVERFQGDKRRLTVHAGKSQQFVIREHELR